MSGPAMNKTPLFALLALLFISACKSAPSQQPLSAAPLAGAKIGGDFLLTDQNGKKRSFKEFEGSYRIVYFGYTNLMAGLKVYEKKNPELGAKIQPIFITVDPLRDTSAVLKQFVSAFHPRAIGLTGTAAEIAEVAKKFAIYSGRVEGSSPENYLISHSQTPYLMGPKGEPLALMPADVPNTDVNEGAPDLVQAELAKWVR